MTTEITDHDARSLARLTEQFRDKTNVRAYLSALVVPGQPAEDALWQLLTERNVDTAVGVQLNVIGSLVGQPRDGLADDDYRRLVRARISVNKSRGNMADLLTVARLVLDDATATIEVSQEFPAAVCVSINGAPITSITADSLVAFLSDTVAAGVRFYLKYSEVDESIAFTFSPDTTSPIDTSLGFSDDAFPLTGGAFSSVAE